MTKSESGVDLSGAQPALETPAAEPAPAEKPVEAAPAPSAALDAARKSVEDAASISGGLWLSYLFTLFYIGIAAGGVTHKDLLLENPVKLPFLNVDLPLVAFFFLAPILFVIVHAYTLLHFVLLAAKVGAYNEALRDGLGDGEDRRVARTAERRRLPSNIFVQFLAGPREIRKGGLGLLLRAIAWISLVIGPVLLLLLIQAQFLPYHLEWVTWVQRVAVVADLLLLWALWPAVLEGRGELKWPRVWRPSVLILVVASLIPVFFAFAAATIPDEWLDRNVAERLPVRDYLFHGYINPVTRRRDSLFSNALVLPGFDLLEAEKIDDETKLAHAKSSFSLRGRHLENAVFDLADLRKADFEGALLKLASLKEAKLQGASLKSAQLQGATLYRADLRGATLDHANLQGATLDGAELQDASLKEAELQGADFDKATDLRSASTWRTNFSRPKLGFSANLKDLEDSPLSREAFASLRATLETEVPDGKKRTMALSRVSILYPAILGPERVSAREIQAIRLDPETYPKALAAELKSLVCAGGESAIFVLRGLVQNDRIQATESFAPGLAKAILACPVSASLTAKDKGTLDRFVKDAPPGAPDRLAPSPPPKP